MRFKPWTLAALSSLLLAGACTGDSNDPGDPNDPGEPNDPDFWLVGDGGTMLGVSVGGATTGYPLEGALDLLAIACFGRDTAYVVGEGGTILQTRDAGQTWAALTLGEAFPTGPGWRAVAPAEATPEGAETVWIVGDAGVVGRSDDGGRSWTRIDGPSGQLRGVATEPSGAAALAVSATGEIWRLHAPSDDEPGGAEMVYDGALALFGVALAAHDDRAVAVGAGGTMLRSDDGGLAWTSVELATTRDLHAVRVAGHEPLSVAVGAGGVVVRVSDGGAEIDEIADAEQGLYALHLREDGTGQAVGAAGVLLRTDDSGHTWQTVALPSTATLRGVDDFHENGHL